MGKALLKLAEKKWFVPCVILLMLLLLFSSFFEKPTGVTAADESEEQKLARLCDRILGTSSASVMFSYGEGATDVFFGGESRRAVRGVAVLCEGGDDPAVQLKIYRLVKSLYAVSGSQISICGFG